MSNSEVTVFIRPGGELEFIYDDGLATATRELGPATTKRVSYVEPAGEGWTADMSPLEGPVLGPFPTRRQALDAEVAWLARFLETATR